MTDSDYFLTTYLLNKKQRIQIADGQKVFGIPQGSIPETTFFFNWLLSDSDTNIAITRNDALMKFLEKVSISLFEWFKIELLKSNTDKFHLLVSTYNNINVNACIF